MKPALIMMPQEARVDKKRYLSDCMKYALNEGCFPLSKETHAGYLAMETDRFIKLMLEICQCVYFFIDYGMDQDMAMVAERAARSNIPVTYVKVRPIEDDEYIIRVEDILLDVSSKEKIPVEVLKSKTRKREVADARFIYFRRAKEIYGNKYSFESIGRVVNRDHATVIHGIYVANNVREVKEKYELLFK